jgi:hypothetical protein
MKTGLDPRSLIIGVLATLVCVLLMGQMKPAGNATASSSAAALTVNPNSGQVIALLVVDGKIYTNHHYYTDSFKKEFVEITPGKENNDDKPSFR